MNNIFHYGSISKIPLYNCSAHTPKEWSTLDGVIRPVFGSIDIAYGVFINLLYIPILGVMCKGEHFKLSCFKIMIFLGIIDIMAITVNSIITGYLAIEGAVFCTYPNLIYISGMTGLGLWCCSCIVALLLVLNRTLDFTKKELGALLFTGSRTYIVLTIPIIYCLYFMVFTTPIAFTSKFMTWFYDPLIFRNMASEYTNIPHGFNNIFIVAITFVFYIYFYFSFHLRMRTIKLNSSRSNKRSLNIFIQSSLICMVNQVAAIIYVFMNFFEVPLPLIMLGHMCWQIGHGAPVFIYLSLNRTIRNDFLKIFGVGKLFNFRSSVSVRPANSQTNVTNKCEIQSTNNQTSSSIHF